MYYEWYDRHTCSAVEAHPRNSLFSGHSLNPTNVSAKPRRTVHLAQRTDPRKPELIQGTRPSLRAILGLSLKAGPPSPGGGLPIG